jgi:thymidylate synthase
MNTSVVYKYRTLEGIIKYEVLEGVFGVDSTLHLRDTSCTHYGNNCEIEVALCEDGKSYQFSKALNDNAKRYEHFHTIEKFWDNEKDAFVEGLEISIDSSRRSIEDYEKELANAQEKRKALKKNNVRYLTGKLVETTETAYLGEEGVIRIIGSILFKDGTKGYLTNSNYYSGYDDGDGDRIILIDNIKKNGKIITENGDVVYLTKDDYTNHKNNNEIDRLDKIIEMLNKNIGNAEGRIEHYRSIINQRDILTVEAMTKMRKEISK